MKVAIISPHFGTLRANAGSSIVIMQYIAEGLSKRGIEVNVYAEYEKNELDNNDFNYNLVQNDGFLSSKKSKMTLKYIPTISDYFSPFFVFTAAKGIKEFSPDVILTGGTSFSSILGYITKLLVKRPVVHYAFEFTDKWKWWRGDIDMMQPYKLSHYYLFKQFIQTLPREIFRRRFLQKKALRSIDGVISSSIMIQNKINNLLNNDISDHVIYPPVNQITDCKRYLKSSNIGSRNIVYIGHLWQGRGVLDLLNAFVSLKKRIEYRDVKLIIAASNTHDITEKYFNKILSNTDLLKDIEMHQVVPNIYEDIIQRAHIVCLPYRNTPSIKLFEMMSSCKPLITTNVGWVAELLTDNVNALVVDPGNVDSIELALRTLLDDEKLSETIAVNAREKFEQCISHDITIDKIISYLESKSQLK